MIISTNELKCVMHLNKIAKYQSISDGPVKYFCSKCALAYVELGKKVIELVE